MSHQQQQQQNKRQLVVLVTGGSGYLAGHLIKQLREQQQDDNIELVIRATVRSLKDTHKIAHLKDYNVEWFEADLSQPNSFDQVIQGVSIVYHVASPFMHSASDPQREIVDPAVQGVKSVLEACIKAPSSSVEKVVLTSSGTAIIDITRPDPNHVYTERDWNTGASLEKSPYPLSKVLAEKAAWEFMEQHKPAFQLTVINPGLIVGPPLNHYKNTSELNTSLQVYLRTISRAMKEGIVSSGASPAISDVRDVAQAHILAAQTQDANGKRLYLGHSSMTWLDLFTQVKKKISSIENHPLSQLNQQHSSLTTGQDVTLLSVLIKTDISTTFKVLPDLKLTPYVDSVIDNAVWFVENGFL